MLNHPLIIGSRGSPLALQQAGWVQGQLGRAGHQVGIKVIKTSGDKLADVNLSESGTKGLFIKEIEEALLAGTVDVAAHSLKDLPVDQPQGLVVAAVPEREDARDVLVSRHGRRWAELPAGARVGTGSPRRQAQLRALRRDLEVVALRGNVDTRLKKLDRGEYDALVLAAAGLRRLGLADRITEHFAVEEMCPAVGQGTLAIEIRANDARVESAVKVLDHVPSRQAARAERALLRCLGGGCRVPIAAHARVLGDALELMAVVASLDGARIIRAAGSGSASESERVGAAVAEGLLRQGAKTLLDA